MRPDRPMSAMRPLPAAILALALIGAAPFGSITSAHAEPASLSKEQADALATYDKALADFKKILAERRAQIDGKQKLPNLPGQAIYLARIKVISTYKDLTDAMPERIGRPNKFDVPPAYFDADIEPLIEEYAALFKIMQAPPTGAQASDTPFKDVADLGTAIARAKGLDAATADAAGRISLGIFFAETNGNQNIGNAPLQHLQGQPADAAPPKIARVAGSGRRSSRRSPRSTPAVAARDAKEEARVGKGDQRYNHWTAVRNGLMNAHADLFAQLPEIMKMLPDEIDQMKFFQLIQIIPEPDADGARLGQLRELSHLRPEDHGVPAQQLACSPSARRTGRGNPRRSAKSSTPCGCSTASSRRRAPSSPRSKPSSGDPRAPSTRGPVEHAQCPQCVPAARLADLGLDVERQPLGVIGVDAD